MIWSYALTWLLALVGAAYADISSEQGARAVVTVTYIANEGVLLSDGTHNVIIDGLFEHYGEPFPMPPDSTQVALQSARGPFANVNLLLVTHQHGDHFHPRPLLQHLRANPGAALLTSRQVVDSLRSLRNGNELNSQIHPRAIAAGSIHSTTMNGVAVHLIGVPHVGLEITRDVEHVVYLVELGGKRFLHTGDADFSDASWRSLALDTARIDVAFIPQWVLRDAEGRQVVKERIAPTHIVAFHVSVGEEATTQRSIVNAIPGATVMLQSLQQWRW